METQVLHATQVKEVAQSDIPSGVYNGVWGGYEVAVVIAGISYNLETKDGIRGINVPCKVRVKKGVVTVEVKE